MAKNYNRDNELLPKSMRSQTDAPNGYFDKLTNLSNRLKWLVWSFIAIAIIMLVSYVIPDKYYNREMNLLLLNIELLIVFVRDIILYFKKSCKLIKAIIVLMVSIYGINIVDLLFNIPHTDYLMLSISVIVVILGFIYFVGNKK